MADLSASARQWLRKLAMRPQRSPGYPIALRQQAAAAGRLAGWLAESDPAIADRLRRREAHLRGRLDGAARPPVRSRAAR